MFRFLIFWSQDFIHIFGNAMLAEKICVEYDIYLVLIIATYNEK